MKNFLQALFAGAVGALAAYFNVLLIPLAVLMGAMLIDYITGMAGAAYTGEINSRVGVTGIIGMVVDYLINSALVNIGINFRIYYCFGMIITIWLIINELISILENLGELKIPLPKFLVNTIKSLKGRVEDAADGKHYSDGGEE